MGGPTGVNGSVDLRDANALVTGAGGDIGRAVARALSELGATVALVGRTTRTLEATAAVLPGPSHVLAVDLSDDDAVRSLLTSSGALFADELDVLVHCAGTYGRGPMDQASLGAFDDLYDANVRAPYHLTQALLPSLKRQRGQVVFVNSTQGLAASEGVGQFAATQHALKAVADSLRAEVNAAGVRVLTLHVGRTASGRQAAIFADEGRPYEPELLLQPSDVATMIASCLTLPRSAEVTTLTIRPLLKTY